MKNVQCFFILTAEAAGDKDTLTVAQTRLQRLRQEYSRFSKAAGLRTENERTQVAGFGRKEAARASAAARKEVEKYSAIRYHEDGKIVVTDDWTAKGHKNTPKKYKANAVVDTLSRNGKQ